ncbi:MAG: hypothetical protein IJP27_04615 [Clostridia bacterium]|nr:hypothetical protein [Clostridia bacterium]
MLYHYVVTPLKEDHFEERVADAVSLVERGISTLPLFCMTLVPEGDPVWDKVGPMAALYTRFRDALANHGVEAGILVQASLGHAYRIEPNPFTRYERISDGEADYICCPEDPAFIAHFQGVLRTLAATHPKAIMLDDDFRMVVRPGFGCCCPLHLAEFNRRTGLHFTKDQLREQVLTRPADPLTRVFEETQRDSLVKAATAFRAAIDEVDPSIQGINCTSGHYCDSVIDTNPIFCGKGHPTMVRVPNGIYAPVSVRGFSDLMRQAAICRARLQNHGIQIALAETDTIPFNRYGKGARHLHAHYVASLLEGLKGAKHWIYRSSAWEPASGKAYRDILAKHRNLYERVATLADGIQWLGVNSAFIEQEHMLFNAENFRRYHSNDWVTLNLERMGLPFYFDENHSALSILEGQLAEDMSDAQLEAALQHSVICDGEAAAAIVRRGYGHLLGVDVLPWDGRRISGECFDPEGIAACTAQKNPYELVLKGATALSYNYVKEGTGTKLLSPAVTLLEREDGRFSAVFCGSPTARFHYTEGFAFLNETRKKQLVELMHRAGALPVYYPSDEEICLRVGRMADGRLLACLYNLGYDPVEQLALWLEKTPQKAWYLQPDGSERTVEFTASEDGTCTFAVSVEPMYPVLLILE